ncbi:MAG: radical SAM protein [Deltaproteobacteria bacterium]|nr:radical SAM protein [Deltaproteobacteria bacterium]
MTDPSPGPRVLAVQPFIHDFAAYDFWARPLGLLSLVSLLESLGCRTAYYDCLDAAGRAEKNRARMGRGAYAKTPITKPPGLSDVDRTYSRYGVPPERFAADLAAMEPPDCVLVTCLMAYWYPGAAEAVRILKQAFPDVPVLLGGVYPALWPDHAATLGADHVVCSTRMEDAVDAVARATGWSPPAGELPAFPRPAVPESPSPVFVPLLTSLGCPNRCAYCASHRLQPETTRAKPAEVAEEILHWRDKGVADFAFYDDALLADADNHLKEILERVVAAGGGVRFHTPNALHVQWLSPGLARLMARAGFHTVRLGLETAASRKGLDDKVAEGQFLRAAAALREAGFGPDRAGAYLLAGLPGQEDEELHDSIRAVAAEGLTPICAWYSPIPGTGLWEAARRSSRYDLAADPIFTNNAVLPCSKKPFDWSRITGLKEFIQSARTARKRT